MQQEIGCSCSNIEIKYHGLENATTELFWLRWLLQDLKTDCSTVVSMYCSRIAIQSSDNDNFHVHAKYIEIECYFVRHHLLQDTLQLRSISS